MKARRSQGMSFLGEFASLATIKIRVHNYSQLLSNNSSKSCLPPCPMRRPGPIPCLCLVCVLGFVYTKEGWQIAQMAGAYIGTSQRAREGDGRSICVLTLMYVVRTPAVPQRDPAGKSTYLPTYLPRGRRDLATGGGIRDDGLNIDSWSNKNNVRDIKFCN